MSGAAQNLEILRAVHVVGREPSRRLLGHLPRRRIAFHQVDLALRAAGKEQSVPRASSHALGHTANSNTRVVATSEKRQANMLRALLPTRIKGVPGAPWSLTSP